METTIFNPFEPLSFNESTCFLTGKELDAEHRQYVSAFPTWLLERYQLADTSISMLDENRMKYRELLLPASSEAIVAINHLDQTTREAFEQGYAAVKKLPELTLFQWMVRVLYGILYHDFTYSIRQHAQRGEQFTLSPILKQKLKNLHLMLQSLSRPVEFNGFKPWSIRCYPVNISKDILNYKDETHRLNFCFTMNDFGMIACLQDNGQVALRHQDMLEKIGHTRLHPAQFVELYAWFIYSNYLLRDMPDYQIEIKDGIIVFSLPDIKGQNTTLFAHWDDKIFAQVLSNMWQPWGITMNQIYKFPNSPISYLISERTYEFIRPEEVNLPY